MWRWPFPVYQTLSFGHVYIHVIILSEFCSFLRTSSYIFNDLCWYLMYISYFTCLQLLYGPVGFKSHCCILLCVITDMILCLKDCLLLCTTWIRVLPVPLPVNLTTSYIAFLVTVHLVDYNCKHSGNFWRTHSQIYSCHRLWYSPFLLFIWRLFSYIFVSDIIHSHTQPLTRLRNFISLACTL